MTFVVGCMEAADRGFADALAAIATWHADLHDSQSVRVKTVCLSDGGMCRGAGDSVGAWRGGG